MIDAVSELLRSVGAHIVMPRYRALAAHDLEEKAAGDPVTIADREAEAAIIKGLETLRPDARAIGEEAVAATPALLKGLDKGAVWIVDPIDGTANFVAGKPPFAIMVALLVGGVTVGAWIHDPLTDRAATAERGAGAWMNGERLVAGRPGKGPLSGIVSQFRVPDDRLPGIDRLRSFAAVAPSLRCAGHEYPLVAQGERDFALYWRTLVWDHAPGALLLEEAGGVVCRLDGSPYRPTRDATGLLLASDTETARLVLETLQQKSPPAPGRRG